MDPLEFINKLDRLYGKYPRDSGGCYKFMILMIGLFDGKGHYNNCHCLTKIGDYYYDYRGRYKYTDTVYTIINGVPVGTPVSEFLSIDEVYGWDFMHRTFSL